MKQISIERLLAIYTPGDTPCFSLYQPTHRHHPENRQDPIRFRNLVKSLENSLGNQGVSDQAREILKEFRALNEDGGFWNHRTDGLAVLASPGRFEVFDLQRSVPELAVVANSFHTKPLLQTLQSADRFQVLCLERQSIRLFEGNRDALDPVELDGIPASFAEAFEETLAEDRGVSSVRGADGNLAQPRYRAGSLEQDIDRDKFFRLVDGELLAKHSRPLELPLILAALPQYHSHFRKVSRNPFLVDEGVAMDPGAMDVETLRRESWKVMEPIYLNRLAEMIEAFRTARSRQLGSEDLSDVARATVAGRVGSLLIEAGRQIPGRIDPGNGAIEGADLSDPEVDDQLDDLAEMVLVRKGKVVVVPAERMPTSSGLAAIYRF